MVITCSDMIARGFAALCAAALERFTAKDERLGEDPAILPK
jgi:hypothetical protein